MDIYHEEESDRDSYDEMIKVKTLRWRSDHDNNKMIQLVDDKIDGSRTIL